MGVGDFELGHLASVDARPPGVVEAFAVEVGPRGAIDGFGVREEVEKCDRITDDPFDHFVVHSVAEIENRSIDVLLDSADLAFGKAFVGVRGGELNTKGMLCPQLGGTVDQGWFLVPR